MKYKHFQSILAHIFSFLSPAWFSPKKSTRNSSANAECGLLLAGEMKNVNMKHGCRTNVGNFKYHFVYTVAVVIPRLKLGVPDLWAHVDCIAFRYRRSLA
jgi:hypothetical protein